MNPSLTIQLITVSIITLERQLIHNKIARNTWNTTYDYIVVGAGSAGCIVAARLTEDPNINVLLLEAGGPLTVSTDILQTAWLLENGWNYYTTPQRRAGRAFINHRMVYQRGRTLGGSSAINFALYNRGNRLDYDNWVTTYGATGWSYNEVLPYFIRTENNTDPNIVRNNPGYHGTNGQMPISTPPNPDPILIRFMEASNRMGWKTVDLNGAKQLGTSLIQSTISNLNWTRASNAASFIEPARNRSNLHVITGAFVTKLLFRNSSGGITGYGVQFTRNNQNYTVGATHEIIVSAGTINSPQLLMLSGVGPRQHLEELGILVILDLPVGNNMMDHLFGYFNYLVNNASDIQWSGNLESILNVQNLYNYYVNYYGPLTQMPFVATYVSSKFNDNPEWPDGFVTAVINQVASNLTEAVANYGSNVEEWKDFYTPLLGNNRHFIIAFALFRPRSRGTIRLSSSNPFDPPLIDPNYFEDKYDILSLVDIMSTGLRISESDFFRNYATVYSKPIPGCRPCDSGPIYNCYSYLACVSQTITNTFFHPVGTCRMGNSSDPKAVVDNELRLKGVKNVRIIDASVMPKLINANTNAATGMIAEKGVQFIQNYRQHKVIF